MANLDLFVGGVPAGVIFKMDVEDLTKIVDYSNNTNSTNRNSEVSFIALMCYFEAFFKNHFASIINIIPSILNNFAEKRPDICLPIKDILVLNENFNKKIGSVIAEQFDFGTAKIINSLYKDLIFITPFNTVKGCYNAIRKFISDNNINLNKEDEETIDFISETFIS